MLIAVTAAVLAVLAAVVVGLLCRRRPAGSPAGDGPAGRRWTRRRALAVGVLSVVAAGAAVVAVRSTTGGRPRSIALRITGGNPLLDRGPVVNVRDLGATGDGRTDDSEAIRRGLASVNRTGGTLFFPPGSYNYRATGPLRPAAGVTIAGAPGSSTILFDHPGAGAFVDFCVVDGDGVTVDGLVVRRAAGFPAVLFNLGAVHGFTLSRAGLIGGRGAFPDADCHGVKLPDGGAASTIGIVDSTMGDLTYGLLQSNSSTAEVTGVTVQRCTFTSNDNTDLEFNSPSGMIRRIRVTDCAFSDNDSAGFGVGLAHISDAVVEGNTFDRYGLEAIHVEDYSDAVVISANRFTACGLRDHSHVQIISGTSNVRVVGNTFHATTNTRRIYVVNALPGGTGPTAGARPPSGPSTVAVSGNLFDCADPAVPVYFQSVRAGSITSNTVTSPAARAPADAFRLLEDPGTAVTGNTINGRTS